MDADEEKDVDFVCVRPILSLLPGHPVLLLSNRIY